jgi:prolyl-tRNA synthetase
VRIVRRDNGAKVDIPVTNLVEEVKVLLDGIQKNLFKTAQEKRDACVQVINTWDDFTTALNNKRLILAAWCDEEVLEIAHFSVSDLPPDLNSFFETLATINKQELSTLLPPYTSN